MCTCRTIIASTQYCNGKCRFMLAVLTFMLTGCLQYLTHAPLALARAFSKAANLLCPEREISPLPPSSQVVLGILRRQARCPCMQLTRKGDGRPAHVHRPAVRPSTGLLHSIQVAYLRLSSRLSVCLSVWLAGRRSSCLAHIIASNNYNFSTVSSLQSYYWQPEGILAQC